MDDTIRAEMQRGFPVESFVFRIRSLPSGDLNEVALEDPFAWRRNPMEALLFGLL
jgi:hypothetical protein